MRHVPHLFVPGPWAGERLTLDADQAHHVERVLRLRRGDDVSYTDGSGMFGSGVFDGAIERGNEVPIPRPLPAITIAVAPPANKDRCRFLVEKVAELGVDHLVWVVTRRGQGQPPTEAKSLSWAIGGLEQSRGAWLLNVSSSEISQLSRPLLVADPGGASTDVIPSGAVAWLIGPEGGLEESEIPADVQRVSLGKTILRVETAAIVAAVITRQK